MAKKIFNKPEDYAYASTRVRLFEKRLLSKAEKAQFLQVESYEEAMKLLQESAYGSRLDDGYTSPEDSLRAEAGRLRRELGDIAEGSPILRLISLEDIYHNLKVLIKIVLLGQDLEHLLVDVDGQDIKWLESLLRQPHENLKAEGEESVLFEAYKDLTTYGDPERVEVLLDKALYREKLELVRNLRSDLLLAWIVEQIDFVNLLIFLRMRRSGKTADWLELALVEGGKISHTELLKAYHRPELPSARNLVMHGASDAISRAWEKTLVEEDIGILEKAKDVQSLEFADRANHLTFGPEVLLAYYIKRTLEIQNLRTLLIALQSGLSAKQRRKRLRVVD